MLNLIVFVGVFASLTSAGRCGHLRDSSGSYMAGVD